MVTSVRNIVLFAYFTPEFINVTTVLCNTVISTHVFGRLVAISYNLYHKNVTHTCKRAEFGIYPYKESLYGMPNKMFVIPFFVDFFIITTDSWRTSQASRQS